MSAAPPILSDIPNLQLQILDQLQELVILRDMEMRIVWANRSAIEALGVEVDHLADALCYKIFHHRHQPCDDCPVRLAMQSGCCQEVEQSANGRVRSIRAIPLHHGKSDKDVIAILEIASDITKYKQIESTLRHNEVRYRMLFRQMLNGFALHEIICDKAGKPVDYRFVEINPAFEKLTGLSAVQVIGKTVREVLPEIERSWIELYGQVALTGKPMVVENYAGPLGKFFKVAVFSPRTGEFATIFEDITDSKRKEQLEEHAQKARRLESLGLLAGGIAHDFNNLLGGMFGYLELARDIAPADSDIAQYLDNSLQVFEHVRSLTRQLLTFAKGGQPFKQLVALQEIIPSAVQFVLSGSNIKTSFALPEDLWQCQADAGQIGEVIHNLVLNCKQEMPGGGMLAVKAENLVLSPQHGLPLADGNYVKITVQDSGPGMPLEVVDKIFDPFFSTKPKGNGLGLPICYSILKRHDGYIDVFSQPGIGTQFYLYLPASPAGIRQPASPARVHKTGRILIMDDEKFILDTASRMLRSNGHMALCASHGAQALDLYRQAQQSGEPIAVVILDLTVPGGMGGQQTVQELRKINPEVKAIVSSGYCDDPVLANPESYGFCGVLPKPYRMKQLEELLQSVL